VNEYWSAPPNWRQCSQGETGDNATDVKVGSRNDEQNEPESNKPANEEGSVVGPPVPPNLNEGEDDGNESEEDDEEEEGRCPECGQLGPLLGCLCDNCEDSGMIYDMYDPEDVFQYDMDDGEEEDKEENSGNSAAGVWARA
jgi:hypothetical protein